MASLNRINVRSLVSLVLVSIIVLTLFLICTSRKDTVIFLEPSPHGNMNDGNTTFKQLLEQSMTTTYGDQRQKYIVYDCSKSYSGGCGGWSDRMSGILSTVAISLLTKRRFLIHYDRPCALEEYLVPVEFDWRYNKSILVNRTSSYQDLTAHNSRNIRKYLTGSLDIATYFHHDVSSLRINWDFTEDFRKRSNISDEIAWITKLTYADIYKQLFSFLFKPSPLLADAIKEQSRHRRRPKLACAHVRIGGNPNMPGDDSRPKVRLDILWKFLDRVNKDEYDIFIASDTNSVKEQARIRYPTNIIDTPGRITHMDRQSKCDQNTGILKQFLDFYTLISCDTLVVTRSGFGFLAAFLRETDSELYCLRGGDLIPCSRYTIENNIFPSEMLAPEIQ